MTSAERKAWNAAKKHLTKRFKDFEDLKSADERKLAQLAKAPGFSYPYDNSPPEAFQSVLCTDGLNPPADASAWVQAGRNAETTGGGFGQLWTWASSPCASKTWTAKDEDSYRGGFSAATSAPPVLVIGNKWDPATNYRGAYKAAKLLKNSAFISSDSWGPHRVRLLDLRRHRRDELHHQRQGLVHDEDLQGCAAVRLEDRLG